MTADELKTVLGLTKHPREGGWYVRTWESEERVELKRYGAARRTSTAIYYLLEPGTFSEMHMLESDEIFHHYIGGAVEMLMLFEDGRSERVLIGKDLEAGERPQHVVPRGVWQGSRLAVREGWALLGCTVSPGFEFVDYRNASAKELVKKWPCEAEMIRELTNR